MLLGGGELGALDLASVGPSVVLDVLSVVADAGCINYLLPRLGEKSGVCSIFFNSLSLVIEISSLGWTIKVAYMLLHMT